MENFKIKILNKEHLSEVLTILHKLGYYWSIVNTGVANNYILTYNDGSMGYARAHRRFEEDSNIEVTLERLIELYETQEDTQKSFVVKNNSMITTKQKEFFKNLINKTKEGKVKWNLDIDNSFSCKFSAGSLFIKTAYSFQFDMNIIKVFINTNDKTKITIASEHENNKSESDYRELKLLHNAAANSYYKVDEILDNLMDELNKK